MSTPVTRNAGYVRSWTSNLRGDALSGIVVALALIPEAIGFSVIAGVDPKVGLYASVVIACTIAFAGGRPAMISAATAATAVVMVDLVREHGVQYLFAATILMGLIQILAGFLRLGRLMRFVSQSVMTGFVTALPSLFPARNRPRAGNGVARGPAQGAARRPVAASVRCRDRRGVVPVAALTAVMIMVSINTF
ncbi:SulP family inorganic anion transporter, partial [Methylobacterium organophilum]|nr:SulP family inorganic anion transporter [Methylobacterium organophilum]